MSSFGLVLFPFVWNLVSRDWYYDYFYDGRVLMYISLSFRLLL